VRALPPTIHKRKKYYDLHDDDDKYVMHAHFSRFSFFSFSLILTDLRQESKKLKVPASNSNKGEKILTEQLKKLIVVSILNKYLSYHL